MEIDMGAKPKLKELYLIGMATILLAIPGLVNSKELEYEFTKEALEAQNPAAELKFKSYQINGATILISGKHDNRLSENEEMQLDKYLGPIIQENSTIIIEFSYKSDDRGDSGCVQMGVKIKIEEEEEIKEILEYFTIKKCGGFAMYGGDGYIGAFKSVLANMSHMIEGDIKSDIFRSYIEKELSIEKFKDNQVEIEKESDDKLTYYVISDKGKKFKIKVSLIITIKQRVGNTFLKPLINSKADYSDYSPYFDIMTKFAVSEELESSEDYKIIYMPKGEFESLKDALTFISLQ